MTAFPERLRSVMGARRVTRKALAGECGVSVQLAQKWIDGHRMPNALALATICRVCHCSMEWLLNPAHMDFNETQADAVRKVLREEGLI